MKRLVARLSGLAGLAGFVGLLGSDVLYGLQSNHNEALLQDAD